MIITQSNIAQLLDNKYSGYFDQSVDDATRQDRYKEIAADIAGTPQISEAKWISFTKTGESPSGKTNIYRVRQKQTPHALLGEIRWYPAFRGYSFFPEPYTIFETRCMADIILFIEAIMHLRPKKEKQPAFVGTEALPGYQGATAVGHKSFAIGHSAGISTGDTACKKIENSGDSI